MGTSIRGTAVRRVEDPHFLTGDATYIDNLTLPGALQVVYVRSVVPHARITSIDVSDALAVPGVVAVYTWPDLGIDLQRPLPFADRGMSRALLAHDVVRFVGEPVAAVLAETRSIAVDAAELVVIDYDALPAVVEVEDALLDEIVLFPEVGTNVAARAGEPTDETLFAGCEVVVECRIVQPRLAPAPLEVRTATSLWESGRLTQWSCSQGAHGAKANLVRFLGVSPDDVRVIVPDVGGGFGAKVGFYPEELLNALFARMLDRPVHWVETRTENLVGMFHGRAQVHHARLGGGRDGTLLAYELEIVQDCGAYPSIGPMMPGSTILMASGAYRIPNVGARAVSVATNTTPVGAYRGAGRPEATAAIERMIDLYAAEIGMDSADLRFRNLIASDSFPYQTPTGACYDSGNYAGALDKLLATAQYEELRAEQRRLRATDSPTVLGIGISVYVEVTNRMGSGEFAAIEVIDGGRAVVRTGSSAHGQGHATAWAMIAADVTGIEMEDIEVRFGDTDEIPRGGGTSGSRSLQVGGAAVHTASEELVELGRKLAADQLEAALEDVELDHDRGAFTVVGTPSVSLSWADLSAVAGEPVRAQTDFEPSSATYPFGAHLAVVEVDTETGQVTLQRVLTVDDAGTILNPMLFDGQVHGGIASGAAHALMETFSYDADGNPLTTTFAEYGFVSAAELPSFENAHQETPTPANPLGAKGIGEAGTIGAAPAVQNAVVDALAHLGVRHLDTPLTAERVWRALQPEN